MQRPKMDVYDTGSFWFQKDEATVHTAGRSSAILQEMFFGD